MYTVRTSSCHVTSLMSRHVTRSAVATDVVVTLDPRSEDPALQIGAAQAGPNGLTYLKLSSAHVPLQLVVLAGRKRAKDTLEGMIRRADQAPICLPLHGRHRRRGGKGFCSAAAGLASRDGTRGLEAVSMEVGVAIGDGKDGAQELTAGLRIRVATSAATPCTARRSMA